MLPPSLSLPMPHKLSSILRPTPRDIDIAQGVTPQPIASIAESLGLSADDYDAYGKYMAKARHDTRRCVWGPGSRRPAATVAPRSRARCAVKLTDSPAPLI